MEHSMPHRSYRFLALLPLLLLAPEAASDGRDRQRGTLVQEAVYGHALEGNLFADSPRRTVFVYLPPCYARHPDRRYPVVYLLHGYQGSAKQWMSDGKDGWDIRDVMDRSIASGKVHEMIVVMPDAKNKLGGSFYTNSVVNGNWEEFLAHDLVAYVDGKYRTLARPAGRGIAGHSMGGYGAILLAMKRPDVFGAVYGLSAAVLGWGGDLSTDARDWDTALSYRTTAEFDGAREDQYLA
jgi:enterochelin esterase-like enzyme